MGIDFGFYPVKLDVDYRDLEIKTRDDFDCNVETVYAAPFVAGDWIYSPPQERHEFIENSVTVLPYPCRVFGLPKTHTLSHPSNDPVRLRFLAWCFGFFVGMRMSDQEAGYLDATPIKPGVSNDIVWGNGSLMSALGTANDFFTMHASAPKIELTLRAAIHSYLASDVPTLLDYERFIHLYTAIDACFAVRVLVKGQPAMRVSHSERIAQLCDDFHLPVPWWADRDSAYVAKQRNEALHEGLFFGEPWGFSIFGGKQHSEPKQSMLLLELQKLTCRIVMAQLGIEAREYLTASVSDRQRHCIRLKPKT